jgi:hypothetical protein
VEEDDSDMNNDLYAIMGLSGFGGSKKNNWMYIDFNYYEFWEWYAVNKVFEINSQYLCRLSRNLST